MIRVLKRADPREGRRGRELDLRFSRDKMVSAYLLCGIHVSRAVLLSARHAVLSVES